VKGGRIKTVHPNAMDVLVNFSWPGNVRQLEHAVEHAFVLAKGDEIGIEHLPRDLLSQSSPAEVINRSHSNMQKGLQSTERAIILKCLEKHHWNKVSVSKELEISRATLWRKMKTFQIPLEPPSY
jgi:transcriptional regulator with PAS, ATPase and Fis domain